MQTPTGTLKSRVQYKILYANIEKRRRLFASKYHPHPTNDNPQKCSKNPPWHPLWEKKGIPLTFPDSSGRVSSWTWTLWIPCMTRGVRFPDSSCGVSSWTWTLWISCMIPSQPGKNCGPWKQWNGHFGAFGWCNACLFQSGARIYYLSVTSVTPNWPGTGGRHYDIHPKLTGYELQSVETINRPFRCIWLMLRLPFPIWCKSIVSNCYQDDTKLTIQRRPLFWHKNKANRERISFRGINKTKL